MRTRVKQYLCIPALQSYSRSDPCVSPDDYGLISHLPKLVGKSKGIIIFAKVTDPHPVIYLTTDPRFLNIDITIRKAQSLFQSQRIDITLE